MFSITYTFSDSFRSSHFIFSIKTRSSRHICEHRRTFCNWLGAFPEISWFWCIIQTIAFREYIEWRIFVQKLRRMSSRDERTCFSCCFWRNQDLFSLFSRFLQNRVGKSFQECSMLFLISVYIGVLSPSEICFHFWIEGKFNFLFYRRIVKQQKGNWVFNVLLQRKFVNHQCI